MSVTEALFRDDAYLKWTEATVVGLTERGGIVTNRTVFYATSGGQPGDIGTMLRADGSVLRIAATVTGETKDQIIHLPAMGETPPERGETVQLSIDWERRYRLMRMHTACHLLTVVCPYPITGAAVAEDDSRVDFDMPEAGLTREEATGRLMELVRADHPVFTRWLEERLRTPGLSIVDGSWYLPAQGRDAKAEYDAGHIPGAVFFDHDVVVDPSSDQPHALPPPGVFAQFAGSMGISVDDTIIVYDGPGMFSAPRVWWMFRIMGARQVYILEGGFDRWKAAGRPATAEVTKIAPCVFKVSFDASRVASLQDMRHLVEMGEGQIADARPAGRFAGTEPEPRPGLRGGHMPGAASVPASSLASDGSLLPPEELRRKFEDAGIDLSRPVVTSCGSGITAAVLTLALETLGHRDNRLYDGSWSEWGGRRDTPVETGGS
jgi:thiosulfate/3-mercaptopyruvate sulfurtransferase